MRKLKTIYPKTFEDIEAIYKVELEFTENQLKLLEQIKRKYKKDGGNFQDFSKNFEGATIYREYCGATYYNIRGYIEKYTLVEYNINGEDLTPDEIMAEIEKSKEKLKGEIEYQKTILNNLEKAYNFTIEKLIEVESEIEKELGKEERFFLGRVLRGC